MRASRLLAILTTLQARGRATASELARENEVSLRTIYRDAEALGAAGIPIVADRGADGGYRLLDGYRMRLNGLSANEAEALFLIGLSGPAADLGLGALMTAAEDKLLAAMPASLRAGARQMRARFHLDAPTWFGTAEQPAHLLNVAKAVWNQSSIRIRYRSWKARKERLLDPLGIVLKGGAWYLVARIERSVRTYRIARIQEVTLLDAPFERPDDFDLAGHWKSSTQRMEADLYPHRATVRLSAWGAKMLEAFLSPYVVAGTMVAPDLDGDGWRRATIPIGSTRQAAAEFLRFGAEIDVLEPAQLRTHMGEVASAMRRIYST